MDQYTKLQAGSASELAERLEQMIVDGALSEGDRLLPIRALAGRLGLSPNTVAAGYRTLALRGVVVGEGRRGTFVARSVSPRPEPVIRAGLVDLASGNPDPDLLPDLGSHLAELGSVDTLYGEPAVDEALAEQACRRLEAEGMSCGPLAVVNGALDGVERALEAHLRPGDAVAIEAPGWPAFADLVSTMGLRPVPVEIDGRGMLPGGLADVIDSVHAVVLTPRVQNPTGAALDRERSAELGSVLERNRDILVVEDDHGGLIAGVALAPVGRGMLRWAFVQSVSKSLGPDLRLAYVTGDDLTMARLGARQAVGTGWVSHILQRLTASVLADPGTGALLDRAVEEYRRRREAMVEALVGNGIWATGRTGLNVWARVPDEVAAVSALAAAGYAVRAGHGFRMGTPPAVRISIGSLDPGMALEVAEVMAGTRSGGRSARMA